MSTATPILTNRLSFQSLRLPIRPLHVSRNWRGRSTGRGGREGSEQGERQRMAWRAGAAELVENGGKGRTTGPVTRGWVCGAKPHSTLRLPAVAARVHGRHEHPRALARFPLMRPLSRTPIYKKHTPKCNRHCIHTRRLQCNAAHFGCGPHNPHTVSAHPLPAPPRGTQGGDCH